MPDLLPAPDQQQPPPAPFVWGAGGAQMTPERIAAERKVAQAMMAQGMDYSPIRSPFQGAARVAQALMGAYDDRRAGQAENANAAADKAMVSSWFGGGAPAAPVASPAAGAGAAAAPSVSAPAPTVLGEGGQPAVADAQGVYGADAVMMPQDTAVAAAVPAGPVPRGIRNNNPLNIEDGRFARSMPGYTGGDGRFATFENPNQGTQAAGNLLDTYQSKYGLNTVRGIVNRWAPSAEAANNTGGYVASVAGRLGIDPDQPLTPAQRPALIAAMGQFENGRPIPGQPASAAVAQADPAALPPNATPTQGTIPAGVPVPTGAVTPAATPGVQAVSGAMQGVNPGVVAAMQSPYTSDATKKIAALILQHQMGDKVTYQTQPDGTILQMDPMGKAPPKIVYQGVTKPTFGQTGEDAFGNKQFGFIDPINKTTTSANAAQGGAAGESAFMAKGVTAIDQELKGPDYLNQFSPEVKSAVQSMIDGNAMPTGNPRKGYTETVKRIAQKYGSDIGIPMDDASFGQRRTMLNNLAVSTPGSLGGQINFAGTSLEHLATAAQKIGELKNVNGLGIAPLAQLVNYGRQLTTEQAGRANAVEGAAQHYGQEVTKFYSGSPGGEAERSRFMKTLSTAKSPTELADALQTERELIPGRLDQIATQIRTTFGEDTPMARKYLARIEESKKSIPKIDEEIAKLRGQKPNTPASAAAPANTTKSGVTWSVE